MKVRFVVLFSLVVFIAKPFIGFSMERLLTPEVNTNIIAKAFTKRKQEFVEESELNPVAFQKLLENPLLKVTYLHFGFLCQLFFASFIALNAISNQAFKVICFGLYPRQPNYLLSKRLII